MCIRDRSDTGRVRISGGNAGLHLLCRCESLSKNALVRACEQRRLRVYFLSDYYFPQTFCQSEAVLLGYAGMTEEQLTAGAALFQQALKETQKTK